MNLENVEEKDLQPPLIIRDENGNRCVSNTTVSASWNGSSLSYHHQGVEPEGYQKSKDTDEFKNSASTPCTKDQELQKAESDYIYMGASDLKAKQGSSPKEQFYMYTLNQTFLEPENSGKESLARKNICNYTTEESVPSCQADLMHLLPLASVEKSTDIEIKHSLGCAKMEDATLNESLITVMNLGDTITKCYEVACIPVSSGEIGKTFTCGYHVSSPKLETFNSSNVTNKGDLPTLSLIGGEVISYIDLVTQNTEQLEKQEQRNAGSCSKQQSPEPEQFNICKDKRKKYMHSTPEHDEHRWPTEVDEGACPLAVQSFDENLERELREGEEILPKVQHLSEGNEALLEGPNEVFERIQNDVPKLKRVADPEHNCQATFVVFGSMQDERALTSPPTAGSKNATFAVFALPDDTGGGTSKSGKNAPSVRDQPRSPSLKKGSEWIVAKSTNRSPFRATITKARKAEIVSFPKPNFKNVKPKVMSRPVSQSKDNAALKAVERSPQLSTASSSSWSSSPKQPLSLLATLRRKPDLEKGTKAETPMNKIQKQHFNKHLPSPGVHAVTHSENVSPKVPKAALKQNVDQVDKAKRPLSSGSRVALTGSPNSGGTLGDQMDGAEASIQASVLRGCQLAQGKECSDDHLGSSTEKSAEEVTKEAYGLGQLSLVSLPKAGTTQGPSFPKSSPATLRSIPPSKIMLHPRRGSETKNTRATKILSPQTLILSSNAETGALSLRGRLTSVKASAEPSSSGLGTKVPIRGFRRSSSISSISSTQSNQSTCSNNATSTTIIKNREWAAKSACQNGTVGSVSLKPGPRPRVLSLKSTPKGAKSRLSSVNQCAPKSAGALHVGKKTNDLRVNQRLGPSAQNGPRHLLSAFNSVGQSKQKSPKNSCIQTRTSKGVHSTETKTHELTQYKRKCENQSGIIQHLKKCLTNSNRKLEALAVVIQHFQSEREEVLTQRKQLSLELLNLRGELATTSSAYEKLEKDQSELQATYERFVQKLNQQHQSDVLELEERLKQFYSAECEKLQNICFEEAEKYKAQLQVQVDNLNITHEKFKLELETSHAEKIEELKNESESSFSELKVTHELEKNSLEESFQEKQEELQKKIAELQSENDTLNEKLKLEEQKRIAKEKANFKNPQMMYLEQELESLKAVLEIKNEKLHQQDIKLLKMEKLVESNTSLLEKMRKLQQENEELKARMDKHMELSRQLSTEQAVLQESLEKESKVNKRLSMENEELLWKLHNGDLCSPRKLSPGTPPMPFQSPRNSSSFSSPTGSPR